MTAPHASNQRSGTTNEDAARGEHQKPCFGYPTVPGDWEPSISASLLGGSYESNLRRTFIRVKAD